MSSSAANGSRFGSTRRTRARLDRQDVLCSAPEVLDIQTAVSFGEYLSSLDSNSNVVINLATLTFCDSSGLRELLQAEQRFSAAGGSLVLRNPPAMFTRLVEVCGLEPYLRTGRP